MNKHGILFQGLRVHPVLAASFLQEEVSYQAEVPRAEDEYLDVTYFLLFAMCQNLLCRSKVKGMKKEWEKYLFSAAEKSAYQSRGFWQSLEKEEYQCARLILGMLEDIRNFEDNRAEKAWISFWYLIRCGFQELYAFFRKTRRAAFQDLCQFAKEYSDIPFLGTSYLCVGFLLAEDLGVEIVENGRCQILYSCIKTGNKLWESEGYTQV